MLTASAGLGLVLAVFAVAPAAAEGEGSAGGKHDAHPGGDHEAQSQRSPEPHSRRDFEAPSPHRERPEHPSSRQEAVTPGELPIPVPSSPRPSALPSALHAGGGSAAGREPAAPQVLVAAAPAALGVATAPAPMANVAVAALPPAAISADPSPAEAIRIAVPAPVGPGAPQAGGEGAQPVSRSFRAPGPAELPLLAILLPVAAGLLLLVGSALFALYSQARRARERRSLDRAKSQFMMVASHELRTPLTIMGGYISMMRDGTLTPASEAYEAAIPVVESQLGQVNSLVDQMLLAARLDEGPPPLFPEPADLRQVAEEAVRQMAPRAGPAHTIRLEAPPRPVPVKVDRVHVRGVIEQLLDNALKYSPAGGEVRCRVSQEEGVAAVDVTDQGIGIADADLSLLFTRFGRLVTADNSQILGLGLGLYVSRELIRLQGGEVIATSKPGVGSTFTIRLPVPRSS